MTITFYFIPTIFHQYYADAEHKEAKKIRFPKRKVIKNKIKIKPIIYVFGLVYQSYSLEDQPSMFGGIKQNL